MRFGEKLRSCRKALKMSQQELAQKSGLGINTISNYEKGHTYPQNRNIYATLAEILKTDPNYLRNEHELIALKTVAEAGEPLPASENIITMAEIVFGSDELSSRDKLTVFRAIQDIFWESISD